MPETTRAKEKTYPAELRELLERGNRGDPTALPAIKRAFDENPEMAALLGDMVRHAEEAVLTLAAGDSVTMREAVRRQADALRGRLAAAATSELERLLIDRVCVCWVEVYYGDVEQAQLLLRSPQAADAAAASTKRLDRAHARFLSAFKALATVTKLVRPALSPLDLLGPAERRRGPAARPPPGPVGRLAGRRRSRRQLTLPSPSSTTVAALHSAFARGCGRVETHTFALTHNRARPRSERRFDESRALAGHDLRRIPDDVFRPGRGELLHAGRRQGSPRRGSAAWSSYADGWSCIRREA